MHKRLLILLVCFAAQLTCVGRAAPDISFHEIKMESSGGKPCTLSLVRFDASQFTLKVISNGIDINEPKYGNLSEVQEKNACVAVTNGGFFDIHPFSPVGYTVIDSRLISGRPDKPWMSGAVMVKQGKLLLGDIDTLLNRVPAEMALQSGPRLVKGGLPENDLTDTRLADRTFVGRDHSKMWVMGIASACTLNDLANFLVSPKMKKIIQLDYVLNLDGGPSSGLVYAGMNEQPPVILQGTATVQNFLGLIVKSEKK